MSPIRSNVSALSSAFDLSFGGYAKLYRNATAPTGIIDTAKSLAGWQTHAVKAREALMQAQEEHEKRVAKIESEYKPEAASKQLAPYVEELEAVQKMAVHDLEEELDEVLEGKRKQFQKSLAAPSDEVVRLLSVLAYRDDITPAEAGSLAAKLGGNLNAMKAFRSILKKSGLNLPELPTEESFESELKEARSFAVDMLGSITKQKKEMSYSEALFYYSEPGTGYAGMKFGKLDSQGFTAVQIEPETAHEAPEKDSAENTSTADKTPKKSIKSGYNATKVFVQGGETLLTMAAQFKVNSADIRKANPDIDFSKPLYHGLEIVVPSTKMSYSREKGAVTIDACVPVHYTPEDRPQYQEGQIIDTTE